MPFFSSLMKKYVNLKVTQIAWKYAKAVAFESKANLLSNLFSLH